MEVHTPIFDTMIAHYLINPDMRHNMDILAETYLGYKPQPITELIGKKGLAKGRCAMYRSSKQTEYAVEDADITLQLKIILFGTRSRKSICLPISNCLWSMFWQL